MSQVETDPAFEVRPMTRAETDLIGRWAAGLGWNPGRDDGGFFHNADPGGFFLGELDGEPIGCISCVAYDDSFGFLGQYIVRREFQGRGYGIRIWQVGMEHLKGHNVGLDAVLDQQANYERSGFRFAYHHVRYRGPGGGVADPGVVDLSAVPFDDLLAYDARVFPASRPRFLRGWVARPGAAAVGCLRDGAVVGYGVIRPSADGYKIGPLFADDPEVADALFRTLLSRAPGAAVVIDAPEASANPHAAELVRRHGWVEVFRTARMYTKGPPPVPVDRVYGITSLELG